MNKGSIQFRRRGTGYHPCGECGRDGEVGKDVISESLDTFPKLRGFEKGGQEILERLSRLPRPFKLTIVDSDPFDMGGWLEGTKLASRKKNGTLDHENGNPNQILTFLNRGFVPWRLHKTRVESKLAMKENGPPTRFVSIFSLASSTLSLSLSLLPISFSISFCTYFLYVVYVRNREWFCHCFWAGLAP